MNAGDKYEATAAALRWILERDYGPVTRDDNGPLPILAGQDDVGEMAISDDGVITVSGEGITLWLLFDQGPFGSHIAARPIEGLSDFMKIVMWPRLVREWDEHRLMAEPVWTEQERAAIDAWEFSKAELRRVIHSDHDKRLQAYPELRELYLAVHSRDSAKLRQYTGALPGRLAQIESRHIQTLAQAIEDGDRELVRSQRDFLTFRVASIAIHRSDDFAWQSDEEAASLTKTVKLRAFLTGVAQRRYAAQFLAFCLSQEMLDIQTSCFSQSTEGDLESYCALVSAFVASKLETIGQKSFYD
jgi:hypothetical protein